ncbi:hypothetical protein AB0I22_29950 [Streptomyces sp. NPDC050610]|uniref:hypothetical protein n=1 Tax=Streptomyces sp. NPDC050610 TaxID=3157097 RepID=UPI00343C36C0
MQATAYTYDFETRSGSVLLDDGTPLPFDAAAFDAGGLRLLRPGQRVRIEVASAESEAAPEKGSAEGAAKGSPEGPGTGSGKAPAADGRRVTLVTLQTF